MTDLQRLIRHGLAPLVIWLVAEGYLPEAMQSNVLEFLVILLSLVLPVAWSWWRDQK